jgi:glutamyl-tRNA synthetase
MTVRTRFAPSPTGYLHIGGARTAIFSWLYARRHGGQFILRIEDTDRDRSTDESIEQILAAMAWLELDFDEGPYRQTDRFDLYQSYVDRLLADGAAYRCVCAKEALDAKREAAMAEGRKPKYDLTCRDKKIGADCGQPFVVRFATPLTGTVSFHDMLRGDVTFDYAELDDMIIARTDGVPTYNFVVVVDDAEMKITHVIRGDDHIANTPRQVAIYQALGLEVPQFAHVSMILGDDGKRLSKRHGALSVLEYRDKGILPEAFVNYMARLGWSCGDREMIPMAEMRELFDFDAVSRSAARFDEEKLIWLNAEYLRSYPAERLAPLVAGHLKKIGVDATDDALVPLIPMLAQRSRTLVELAASCRYFFVDDLDYDEKGVAKFFTPDIADLLDELADRLGGADFSAHDPLDATFNGLLEERNIKMKILAQPTRLALTGRTVSPGLFEVMEALGKERSVARIRAAAALARGNG